MAQIHREGSVSFGDASLAVWEEGIADARKQGGYQGAKDWERQFKRDVFARIVQTLNRLGWTVGPQHYIFTGNNARFCQKGDLKGDLKICGRHIEFDMFQSINCPTRPDHEGRYESDKEGVMPYLLRLEMERTRRRIRDYLCNVFDGYSFDAKHRSIYRKPLERTAMECIQAHYAESWHFKGVDWEKRKTESGMSYNLKSADGVPLEHGQRVYFYDRRGRICTGTALYNINNMWWVVTGKYDYTNMACFELHASIPEDFRAKRNERLRRKRLENELQRAIQAKNFERAATLRDLIFPKGAQLFVVRHKEHDAYHCANFQGYTQDLSKAGRFLEHEIGRYRSSPNEVIPV